MIVRFLDPLQVERLGEAWRTTRHFRVTIVEGSGAGALPRDFAELFDPWFIVPAGFVSDLASVPRLPLAFWIFGDTAHQSAVLHDYLYEFGATAARPPIDRELLDRVFLAAMEAEGLSWWRRRLMFAAVRLAGGSRYQAKESAP